MSIKIINNTFPVSAGACASVATASASEQQQLSYNGFESWLPWAAKRFAISANPADYYLNTTVILISDLPNRNGVGFPLTELIKWNRDLGKQAYKGWIGMPLHIEHKSDVDEEAIGVVADVAIAPVMGYNGGRIYKVLGLVAVDRTKNLPITGPIVSGAQTTWSMGAMVGGYKCSYCDAEVGECNHIHKDDPVVFYEKSGILVNRNVYDITPFEFSHVSDPAYGAAIHNHEWRMSY